MKKHRSFRTGRWLLLGALIAAGAVPAIASTTGQTNAPSATALAPASMPASSVDKCARDSDCKDGNGDTIDWCENRTCYNVERTDAACQQGPDSCEKDRDCRDGDGATIDWCEDSRCYRAPRDSGICAGTDACRNDSDCKDGDGSTFDWCEDGSCFNVDRDQASCRVEASSCHNDDDCRDGDSDTIEWCHDKQCYRAERDAGICQENRCVVDEDCDDGRSGTVDWCGRGACYNHERATAACVERESVCRTDSHCDDDDDDTVDWCHNDTCFHSSRDGSVCRPTGGFEVVDFEYLAGCRPPLVGPSISSDGNTVEIPFEGTGFSALGDRELGIAEADEECHVLITVSVPRGRQVAPAYIDAVGEADIGFGARGTLSANFRLIGGGQSPDAVDTRVGPFVGGMRARSRTMDLDDLSRRDWSRCGQRYATFRVSAFLSADLQDTGQFAEVDLTNATAGNEGTVTCGYAYQDCR